MLEIKRLVEAAGFVWVLDKKSGDAYEILSIRAIINACRLLGGAAFSCLLVLLDSTWHGASISLRVSMGDCAAYLLSSRIKEPSLHLRRFHTQTSICYRETTGD